MLNKVILMGRLTRDPDFKATPSGTSVCNFSLAVDRDFVRQGEERQADFINIVAFGSRAEFVSRYFHKGQLVAVCGRIQTRSWDDAQTGQKRYATDVVADEVHFAEPKRDGVGAAPSADPYMQQAPQGFSAAPQGFGGAPQGFSAAVDDDQLPF
ncbi:MAG: single-stranded DNA-binding protein [Clostridia bacterium]|nr:single-stranded DNA-binding protein [Clostridia bacterium]